MTATGPGAEALGPGGPDGGPRIDHIGLVAAEPSGDALGASLISALRRRAPEARFSGIGGPRMAALGFHSLAPLDALSVMGFVEPLRRLPALWALRRRLVRHFMDSRPAVCVGIDAPDFNLGWERRVRAVLPVAHYVSPKVWAWRPGRVHSVAAAVDLLMTVLPFEADCYRGVGLSTRYVGHPLADEMPLCPDREGARAQLGLAVGERAVAVLPGSRMQELELLAEPFLLAARRCLARCASLRFVWVAANARCAGFLRDLLATRGEQPAMSLVEIPARRVMAACDAALLAAGTASLEAMLSQLPMVVAYRLTPWSYRLARATRLSRMPYFCLPNWLAGQAVVPELIQHDMTPEALCEALWRQLNDEADRRRTRALFASLHRQLRRNAAERAAAAVLSLCAKRR